MKSSEDIRKPRKTKKQTVTDCSEQVFGTCERKDEQFGTPRGLRSRRSRESTSRSADTGGSENPALAPGGQKAPRARTRFNSFFQDPIDQKKERINVREPDRNVRVPDPGDGAGTHGTPTLSFMQITPRKNRDVMTPEQVLTDYTVLEQRCVSNLLKPKTKAKFQRKWAVDGWEFAVRLPPNHWGPLAVLGRFLHLYTGRYGYSYKDEEARFLDAYGVLAEHASKGISVPQMVVCACILVNAPELFPGMTPSLGTLTSDKVLLRRLIPLTHQDPWSRWLPDGTVAPRPVWGVQQGVRRR